MKSFAMLLSAAALLFASAAHADTYNFTLTPAAGGTAITFSLNTAGIGYSSVDEIFVGQTVFSRVDVLGSSYAPFDLGLCTNGNGGGCSGTEAFYTGPQLYVQNGSGVSILTGSFNLALNGVAEKLNIVDATTTPVAVTPEPSSLLLLGTGLLGVAGIVKRRLV